jgi:outer membrane protein assembly factor BamB
MKTQYSRYLLIPLALLLSMQSYAVKHTQDPGDGRQAFYTPLKPSNVGNLKLDWTYQTVPYTGNANTPLGSISSTPAQKGKFVYFNDLSGNITKLNRFTGKLIWKKNYLNDLSAPGFEIRESRNTPYLVGNLVIVGSNYGITAPLCRVNPSDRMCNPGDGAIILALNKKDGSIVWRQKADTHPASKITGSISGTGNMLLIPIGNWEEDWARVYPDIYVPGTTQLKDASAIVPGSKYPCCSARGGLTAMDINGNILWKSYTVPGDGSGPDANGPLAPELKALLTPRGFQGASSYGMNPSIDTKRGLVYIASAQNSTAPQVAELCEKSRMLNNNIPTPYINPSILPPGFTFPAGVDCLNLNDKLHNYANSMIAMSLKDGRVVWAFHAHQYDAWNHSCGAPDFYGMGNIVPIVFAAPGINNENCFQDPVGPDLGFGVQPVLVKNLAIPNSTALRDLVIAGNKDGRVFAIDADTRQKVWEANVEPGGIYGGIQFGLSTDGKRIFVGTSNSRNVGRGANENFVSNKEFLTVNGFDAIPVRVGGFVKSDSSPTILLPAPSSFVLPFPGPDLIYGINFYSMTPAILTGPSSGPGDYATNPGGIADPSTLWTLVNPPSDVIVDNKTVFQAGPGAPITTTDGMVVALDAATGRILWQRPANDGIAGSLQPSLVSGTLTVTNGMVFAGYADGNGTMVILDALTGKRLFKFNAQIPITQANGSVVQQNAGSMEGGPLVVGRRVYWGAGGETAAPFPNKNFVLQNGGNTLYTFKLPAQQCREANDGVARNDDGEDDEDQSDNSSYDGGYDY